MERNEADFAPVWGSHADKKEHNPRILSLFEAAAREKRPLYVSAPMVRYSKLPFRQTARHFNTDVTYTPMILAHEFIRSSNARDSDFTTHPFEREPTPDGRSHALIAQFASSDPTEFARAAEMIAPWVDGVDLNCGCPQSWAVKEGIGCSLMENPSLVAAIVRAAKAVLGPTHSVSVKIRIHKDLSQTQEWIRIVQAAGIDYLTIHGRLRAQRSSTPPDYAAIRALRTATTAAGVRIPVIANGDAYTLADVRRIAADTGADGVMAARGILENPALFAGEAVTPLHAVGVFVDWAVRCPVPFALVLHHVGEMTARMEGWGKKERKRLMGCVDLLDLLDFVEEMQAGEGER